MLFIIRIINIIILASALHTGIYVENKTVYNKAFLAYALMVLCHNSFVLLVQLIVPDNYAYIDYAAPWGLLHGPFLFFCYYAFKNKKIERKLVYTNLIVPLLFFVGYIFLLFSSSFRYKAEFLFLSLMYALMIISWLSYAIYILNKIIRSRESSYFFAHLSVFYIIISVFMSTMILVDHPSMTTPGDEINVIAVSILMLLLTLIIFNTVQHHLTENYRFVILTGNRQSLNRTNKFNNPETSSSRVTLRPTISKDEIDNFFSSKIVTDTDLTLKKSAELLRVTQKKLSIKINKFYNVTFAKFIIQKRVEYACKLILEDKSELELKNLHQRCGFGSNASFYRNFREQMNCTPTEYKNLNLKLKEKHNNQKQE